MLRSQRLIPHWVLDVDGRRLIVHREPVEGRYQSVVAFGESVPCGSKSGWVRWVLGSVRDARDETGDRGAAPQGARKVPGLRQGSRHGARAHAR